MSRKPLMQNLLLILIVVAVFPANAQQDKQVELLNADRLLGRKIDGQQVNILIGNVKLKHDSSIFYCDSAHLIRATNSFNAFDNVYIMVSDSVDIYADRLEYDGNTRIAELFDNVKLIDANKATLYTDYLLYDRNTRIAYYNTGGRIVDKENELISEIGYYYTSDEIFHFKQDVVLTTPDYLMLSDTLKYHTETEIAYITGPTNIIGEEDSVYCERGWYDTQNDIADLRVNAFVKHKEQTISGDSLFYNKGTGYGRAENNVVITDSLQEVIVKGNLAILKEEEYHAWITDSTLAIFIDNRDSLFLHADTMKVLLDSNKQAETVIAYKHVKFFRTDLQGLCDSLVYHVKDSLIAMYKGPALWSDENQLTADSIKIALNNQAIDSMALYNNCFIISRDGENTFNQIKGKQMVGYFKHNEIFKITVSGNSESIYFVREEDNNELIGINIAVASDMLIYLEDRKMTDITYITQPKAPLYPDKDVAPQDRRLRGFKWLGFNRPSKMQDIFYWNTGTSLED
ncbi:MAG: hypothetical protein K9G67_05775 [Bacteroidales bacterium]|nr:hypothetical protein [Bacteroidales bacterium]MCF8343839.1 hypothetical protein [Bacteroidales bacterium]MCF8351028.1 hypothetical protein [Bacteroidales bacterium]MCF8375844.1 hypothetical protein [Bacteroidales bacterium]MCF8401723.1 hypothetical protein [Bacteroidales bacterium]